MKAGCSDDGRATVPSRSDPCRAVPERRRLLLREAGLLGEKTLLVDLWSVAASVAQKSP